MSDDKSARDATPAGQPSAVTPRAGLRGGVVTGIVFAAIGAALTWAVLQACFPVFGLPEEFQRPLGTPPPEVKARLNVATARMNRNNAIFALGLFGATVAGLMGVGEGIARRSLVAALLVGGLCAVVGAAVGSLAGLAGHLLWESNMSGSESLPLEAAVLIHAVTLLLMGGGVGLAIGGVAGRSLRTSAACLLAGMLAGATAGVLYPFLGAVLAAYFGFQANTDLVVPPGEVSRLFWIALPAVLLGLLIPGLKLGRTPRSTQAAEPRGASPV